MAVLLYGLYMQKTSHIVRILIPIEHIKAKIGDNIIVPNLQKWKKDKKGGVDGVECSGYFDKTLTQHWYDFDTSFWKFWDHFDTILGVLWDNLETTLVVLLDNLGTTWKEKSSIHFCLLPADFCSHTFKTSWWWFISACFVGRCTLGGEKKDQGFKVNTTCWVPKLIGRDLLLLSK